VEKVIEDDIEFRPFEDNSELWVFDGVLVTNDLGHKILLNGAYDSRTKYIKFNFVLKRLGRQESGPICRLEIRGKIHPGAGRTHKQDVQGPKCIHDNLPHAVARPDYEACDLRDAWDRLCQQANITHAGQFREPQRGRA
jgi:hypothetical protein